MTEKRFVPLLFAGDINVYSVARAFHQAYGIKSYVYGKFYSGPCLDSKIINYTADPAADEQETFLTLVTEFARVHADKKVLLIGCGDSYVELASANKGNFPGNVIVPYIDISLMHELINKEKFYSLCEKNGVDHPETFIHREESGYDIKLPFNAPYIIKPSNGIEYWRHPFKGQEKVFKAESYERLTEILKSIYDAGYADSLIIQDMIPGDDTYMRVLTNYSDRQGKVSMMCLGHVLLEEHTPHGIGNHAVIITEQNIELEEKIKKMLEKIGYTGFSNFDIKYDSRDGKFKAFEINTRQGRSNFYVTGSGANVAEYFVRDHIYGENMGFHSVDTENLWMVVPKKVAFDYIREEYHDEMKRLIREDKFQNPLIYEHDNKLKRKLGTAKLLMGHHKKFKKYLGK